MVRLQDDFASYVNGAWAGTAVIPDDKPSTSGFTDFDPRYRKRDVGYYQKIAREEKSLTEDSILQNFVKYHKMVADFDAQGSSWCGQLYDQLEIKALSSFEDYTSKLGTMSSWQTKSLAI